MKDYLHFSSEVWFPQARSDIFPFFEDARNLEILTPKWLNFKILTPLPIVMKEGVLIDYRIRLHGISFKWRTEITVWEPPLRFVDTQIRGPYRAWIHEHRFKEKNGGTMVSDEVKYYPWGGKLVNRLFVRSQIERIFRYRADKLVALFSAHEKDPTANNSSQHLHQPRGHNE